MKRVLLLMAFATLVGVLALAQNTGDQSGASGQSNSTEGSAQYQNPDVATKSSAKSSSVIRGCLSGSSGNYTLTDQNGMQYQIAGDDATLRSMVGREVEVTGIENQTNQSEDTTSRPANGVQASGVRAVSATCKKNGSVSAPPPVDNNGMNPKGTPESAQPPKPE